MSKQGLLRNRLKESPFVSQSELSHNHKAWQKISHHTNKILKYQSI